MKANKCLTQKQGRWYPLDFTTNNVINSPLMEYNPTGDGAKLRVVYIFSCCPISLPTALEENYKEEYISFHQAAAAGDGGGAAAAAGGGAAAAAAGGGAAAAAVSKAAQASWDKNKDAIIADIYTLRTEYVAQGRANFVYVQEAFGIKPTQLRTTGVARRIRRPWLYGEKRGDQLFRPDDPTEKEDLYSQILPALYTKLGSINAHGQENEPCYTPCVEGICLNEEGESVSCVKPDPVRTREGMLKAGEIRVELARQELAAVQDTYEEEEEEEEEGSAAAAAEEVWQGAGRRSDLENAKKYLRIAEEALAKAKTDFPSEDAELKGGGKRYRQRCRHTKRKYKRRRKTLKERKKYEQYYRRFRIATGDRRFKGTKGLVKWSRSSHSTRKGKRKRSRRIYWRKRKSRRRRRKNNRTHRRKHRRKN